LKVLREGAVEAGDAVDIVKRGYGNVAIKPLFEAYLSRGDEEASRTLARALEIPELSPEWRAQIQRRLERRQT
jgi:MOSC domain-containing protein YiiM